MMGGLGAFRILRATTNSPDDQIRQCFSPLHTGRTLGGSFMKKPIGLVKRTMTLVLSLFVCLSFSAQAQNLVPYDSFNGTFINPSKWSTFPVVVHRLACLSVSARFRTRSYVSRLGATEQLTPAFLYDSSDRRDWTVE